MKVETIGVERVQNYEKVTVDKKVSTTYDATETKKVENKELLEMKGLNEEKVEKEIIAYMEERVKSAEYEEMTEERL